jgi:hypothetical protein
MLGFFGFAGAAMAADVAEARKVRRVIICFELNEKNIKELFASSGFL